MDKPNVFTYDDFRRFLLDWWKFRRESDPDLTKSEMSRRLGLPNTRSYFTDVLGGKKVTDLFLDRFELAMDLSIDETRFFRALVQFNQADTPEAREVAFDSLVAYNRTPHRRLDPKEYSYYRHWWNGAIRAVLAIEDHGDDWDALAMRIQPAITAKQARTSVELMSDLGLVEVDGAGHWKPRDAALSTGDHIRETLVQQVQMQWFDVARLAIMTPSSQPRDFATSTIHVSRNGLEQIRSRLDKFRSEIRSIAQKDPDAADRVYSLCLAFFPLTGE
jgi:uncharacterized protein (TIGR02147 family)